MRTFCEAMDNDFSFAMNALHQQGFVTHSNLITHAANALRGVWETDGAITAKQKSFVNIIATN